MSEWWNSSRGPRKVLSLSPDSPPARRKPGLPLSTARAGKIRSGDEKPEMKTPALQRTALPVFLSALCFGAFAQQASRPSGPSSDGAAGPPVITEVVPVPDDGSRAYATGSDGRLFLVDAENGEWIALEPGSGSSAPRRLRQVSVSQADPAIVLVLGQDGTGSLRLYVSTDRGGTWDSSYAEAPPRLSGPAAIAQHPETPSMAVIAAAEGAWLVDTTGEGAWTHLPGFGTVAEGAAPSFLVFGKAEGEMTEFSVPLYAGLPGKGVALSRDLGKHWELLPGSPVQPRSAAVSDTGQLYVTNQCESVDYEGLFIYNGIDWQISPPDRGPFAGITVSRRNPRIAIASSESHGETASLYATMDAGEVWRPLPSPIADGSAGISLVAFGAPEPESLFAVSDGRLHYHPEYRDYLIIDPLRFTTNSIHDFSSMVRRGTEPYISFDPKGWVMFGSVDFGDGVNSIQVNARTDYPYAYLLLRLDDENAYPRATVKVLKNQEFPPSDVVTFPGISGVHDVYLAPIIAPIDLRKVSFVPESGAGWVSLEHPEP